MKPEFMRLRRALATAFVAILAATGLAIVAPLSASAHDSSLSPSASCTADGTYTVVYTGSTSNVPDSGKGHTATLTLTASAPASSSVSLSTSTVVGNTAYTITQKNIPGNAKSASIGVHLAWGDRAKADPTGRIALAGTCAPPPPAPGATLVPAAVCDTGSGTYTVDYTGTPSHAEGKSATLVTAITAGGGTVTAPGSVVGNAPFTISQKGIAGSATSAGLTATLSWADAKASPSSTIPLAGTCTKTKTPEVSVSAGVCTPTSGGPVGTVTVTLGTLVSGTEYTVQLFSGTTALATKTIDGTATGTSFAGLAPGTYHVVLSGGSTGSVTSNEATIGACIPNTPTISVTPTVCIDGTDGPDVRADAVAARSAVAATGAGEVEVTLSGLSPYTDYTIGLVAKGTTTPLLDSVSRGTADGGSTFSHSFTGVVPGDYQVVATGARAAVTSEAITMSFCPPTLALDPAITVNPTQCQQTGDTAGALSYDASDLNPAVNYRITLTQKSGAAVSGFTPVTVPSGKTEFSGTFTTVPPGTYIVTVESTDADSAASAQSDPIALSACDLTTLAFTGAGAYGPLGAVAALLLTLGGAIVLGRLRRRATL
jgi:hypothetical protein